MTAACSSLKSAWRNSGRAFSAADLIDAGVDRNARNPMLQRNRSGELIEFLENLNENHLAKVFFGGALRAVGAHHS